MSPVDALTVPAPGQQVVVVGAGLAGLSSAVRLAERGHQVTLVEKRGRLGGRTFSLAVPGVDGLVDNGQHLFAGFYEQLRHFLRTIGTEDLVRWDSPPMAIRTMQRGLLSPKGMSSRFSALARLASPLWILGLPIPHRDRPAAARTLLRIARAVIRPPIRLDSITIDEWFREIGAPQSLRDLVLDQVAIGTVNEKPHFASAYTYVRTMHEALQRDDRIHLADAGWPRVPLQDLFVAPAEKFLAERGAQVIRGQAVRDVELVDGQARAVVLANGTRLQADAVILAVPPWSLGTLLSDSELGAYEFFEPARQIGPAPISSVYVWLDRHLGNELLAENLRDTTIEWVFHTSGMHGASPAGAQCYSLAVSASWDVIGTKNDDFVAAALASLRMHYPAFAAAQVLRTHVIHQPQATFSARPGFEKLRLPQTTPIPNLFLAGDWTQTNLCSTMEGAVESAARAIDAFDEHFGS